ncbi:MAG: hypothetical protein OEW39_15640 [Deltaproteobacteria bacterium]|nr:hypothetical protein [Deltaproteobacteria bacterium]
MPTARLKPKSPKTQKATPKRPKAAAAPGSKRPARATQVDTLVREGDFITFSPTGEQLRVAKIEAGQITFEKTT